MRVLDLFSNDRICFLPENFPENIDLQEFHVRLVRRAYRMEYANNGGETSCFWSLNSDKVVIFSSGEDSAIVAIHSGGKLGFLKSGNDERWRILDNSWNVIYEDIMLYRENCCIVVDDKGKTVVYNVDFKVSDLAEGLVGGGGHKKHLVECSGGEVLLVDKYVKHVWCNPEFSKSAVEFRVYKLKREDKRWEESIHSLWRERNSRRHGESAIPASKLAKIIDKNVRNRFSTLQRLGNSKLVGGLQFWFHTRNSSSS